MKKSIDIKSNKSNKQFNLDEIEGNLKIKEAFDWRGASLTLILVIIAIWSAYFVTILISGKPLPRAFRKSAQKTSTPQDSSALTKKLGAPTLPDGSSPKTDTSTDTSNPFKPLNVADVNDLKNTTTPAPATPEIAKDSFKIRILNGNGTPGDAAKAKDDLATKGYNIGTIGNATLKYTNTTIYYVEGQKVQAGLLATDLQNKNAKQESASQDLVGEGFQILLVLGTDK